jgi:hypothetical protein
MSQRDILWLSESFREYPIPQEKQFLKKYFKSKSQTAFLHYILTMGDPKNFIDHTGYEVAEKSPHRMARKLTWLLREYDRYKSNMELDKLALLNAGKIRVPLNLR